MKKYGWNFMSILGTVSATIVLIILALFLRDVLVSFHDSYYAVPPTQVVIPEGYTFVDIVSHPEVSPDFTVFCELNNGSHRLFDCTGGEIRAEVYVPAGYKVVAVTRWSIYSTRVTLFCQDLESSRVSACQ